MPSLNSVWTFVRGLTAMLAAGSTRLRGNLAPPTVRDAHKCWTGPLKWESVQGEVRVNNEPFHIKGTNWYGFETAVKAFHGLDQRSMDEYFEFMQANKFNALRVPFSLKFALNFDEAVDGPFVDGELQGMSGRDLLNHVISKAAEYNILVLLDLHRLNDQFIPQLWYSDEHSVDDVLAGWDTVLGATKQHWNVFAVDLKNEPFGVATWGDDHPATDWNKAAVDIAKHLLKKHDDWTGLVFVEGINYSTDFRGIKRHPLDFGSPEYNHRMVLSPHQYGPSVVMLPMFLNESFPANMPEVWHNHWGFVEEATGRAAVLGEWGGHYTGLDRIWQDAFSDYLIDSCLSDQFQWDLNPDSGDTGGLFKDDWRTPEVDKLKVLDRVQPDPSFMVQKDNGDELCLIAGTYANPDCDPRRPNKNKPSGGRR